MKIRLLIYALCLFCASLQAQEKKNGKVTITESNGNTTTGKMKRGQRTGEWTTRNRKDVVVAISHYKAGGLHGSYVGYYPNGKTKNQGEYQNGKREGRWITFYDSGDTLQIEHFLHDTLHGYYIQKHLRGGIRVHGNYVHGNKEGMWIRNDNLSAYSVCDTMHFVNGKMHGIYKAYHNSWLFERCMYDSGAYHGERIRYHEKSTQVQSIGYFKHGLKDSIHSDYFPDGRPEHIRWYSNDRIARYDSVWRKTPYVLDHVTHYFENGQVKFIEEHKPDGSLKKKQYNNSNFNNVDSLLLFCSNNVVSIRRTYTYILKGNDWRAQGMQQFNYTCTGKLTDFGPFDYMVRNGSWTFKDTLNGKTSRVVEFQMGYAEGSYESFYPNGKKKVTGVCRDGYLTDSIQVYSSTGVLLKKKSPQYEQILNDQMREDPLVEYRDPDQIVEIAVEEDIEELAPVTQEDIEYREDPVLSFAETMPAFPGDSLQSYLQHNLRYPQLEKEAGKQGTVYVEFIVEKDGSITNVKAIKEVHGAPGLTKEAVRVCGNMPRWNPGLMNGRPVRVRMVQPIKFTLQ